MPRRANEEMCESKGSLIQVVWGAKARRRDLGAFQQRGLVVAEVWGAEEGQTWLPGFDHKDPGAGEWSAQI